MRIELPPFLEDLRNRLIRFQVGRKTRLSLYRKIARFQRAGQPVAAALSAMYQHSSHDGSKPNTPAAVCIRSWLAEVSNGRDLSDAMAGWVPEQDRMIIKAGEQSGQLDKALDMTAFVQDGSRKIMSKLKMLIYPAFIMAMTIGFLVGFSIYGLPKLAGFLPMDQWTGHAARLGTIATFIADYLLLIGVALIGLLVAIAYSMPNWTGDLRVKFDRYPPWSIYRLYYGSSFLLGLSAMVSSGLREADALQTMLKSASPWFRERLQSSLSLVNNGRNIGDALYQSGYEFPDRESVIDLRSFAEVDGFAEILEAMGREWMDESVEKIETQIRVLQTLSMFAAAGVIGVIVLGVMDLQQQLRSSVAAF